MTEPSRRTDVVRKSSSVASSVVPPAGGTTTGSPTSSVAGSRGTDRTVSGSKAPDRAVATARKTKTMRLKRLAKTSAVVVADAALNEGAAAGSDPAAGVASIQGASVAAGRARRAARSAGQGAEAAIDRRVSALEAKRTTTVLKRAGAREGSVSGLRRLSTASSERSRPALRRVSARRVSRSTLLAEKARGKKWGYAGLSGMGRRFRDFASGRIASPIHMLSPKALLAGMGLVFAGVLLTSAVLMGSALVAIPAVVGAASDTSSTTAANGLVAAAEAEYASGVSSGTLHHDDSTYWDFVMGGGYSSSAATPWCACFVSYCANKAGLISDGTICETAAVSGFYAYFSDASHGSVEGDPQKGDIILYDKAADGSYDHTGIVTATGTDDGGSYFICIEGNTSCAGSIDKISAASDNGTSSVVMKKKVYNTGSAGSWASSYYASIKFCRPKYATSASGTIIIPDEYGNGGYTVTEYDKWVFDWGVSAGTSQKSVSELWIATGALYTDGIASVNGRYLVACTSKYGNVGDNVDFYLADGTLIPCTIADQKNEDDAGCNEWGHSEGQNIIEFEVSSSMYERYGNPGSSSWMPEWSGKRVASATNLGSSVI